MTGMVIRREASSVMRTTAFVDLGCINVSPFGIMHAGSTTAGSRLDTSALSKTHSCAAVEQGAA